MKKYIVDGKEFNELPAYMQKGDFMRPVTSANFDIQEVEYEVSESPEVTAFRAELLAYIETLNTAYPATETRPAPLGLSIEDNPAAALVKLKTAGVTWTECCTLDMLRRNLADAEAMA